MKTALCGTAHPSAPIFPLLSSHQRPIAAGCRLQKHHSAPFAPGAAPPSSSTPSSGYKGRALTLLHFPPKWSSIPTPISSLHEVTNDQLFLCIFLQFGFAARWATSPRYLPVQEPSPTGHRRAPASPSSPPPSVPPPPAKYVEPAPPNAAKGDPDVMLTAPSPRRFAAGSGGVVGPSHRSTPWPRALSALGRTPGANLAQAARPGRG
jgi:hypothetical protein